MEGSEKILSLVNKVLQNELSLEQAIERLSSSQLKPYLNDEVIYELDKMANQLELRNVPLAFILSSISYEACKIIENTILQPHCGFTLGRVLLDLCRSDEAIPLLEEALKMFIDREDRMGEGSVFCNLGRVSYSVGDYSKAIDYYQKALKIAQEIRDKEGEEITLGNLGNAYQSLGDYPRALENYQKALKIAQEIEDRLNEGGWLANLGNVYYSLGNYPRAIENYQKALKIAQEIKYRKGEGGALGNLGNVYHSIGEYYWAIEYYQKALKISQEIGYRKGEEIDLGNLGVVHDLLGDYCKALENYEKALKISQEIGDKHGEGRHLGNLGNAYYSHGDYPRALENYQKALKIAQDIEDRRSEEIWLGNLGNAYDSLRDHPRAMEYYRKAMKIAQDIGDKEGEGRHLGNLGIASCFLGDYCNAIEYFNEALKIAREIGNMNLERIWLANLGLTYDDRLKQHSVAYSYYKQSIVLAEKIRGTIKEEEHKTSFVGTIKDVYGLMILLCNRMKREQKEKVVESFEYLERSKSRTFLESLAHTPLKPSAKIPAELIKRENELLEEVRALYLRREKQMIVSLTQIQKLESELDEVWNKIEKIDPEYVSMRRGKPLDFLQIQQMIKSQGEEVCLVEYFLSLDKLLIFILRSDDTELKVEEIDIPSQRFNDYLKNYLEDVYSFGQKNIGQIWQDFSKYLIEPISKYLDNIDTIYFVPQHLIHYLPLHALKYDGYYLTERYKIVYSPSASVINYCQKKRRDKRQTCLSLGVVFEEEADRVAEIFKGSSSVYKGTQVTKKLVEEKSKGKDIIHFSCHGFFLPPMPMKSGLLLAEGEILTVEDIFQLKLNADLVTLSACQTGINEQKPGDDLVGLTRSFIYAGTPSVVVSLWPVSAPSTLELMEKLYSYLKDGNTKIESLQKAQLNVMNNPKYSHPHYWAPFILVGDWK